MSTIAEHASPAGEPTVHPMYEVPLERRRDTAEDDEHHSPTEADCIEELERCSLQDNEKCNCVWQAFRATHGIFHWMNSISCVRRKRKADDDDDDDDDDEEEQPISSSGSPPSLSVIAELDGGETAPVSREIAGETERIRRQIEE